MSQAVSTEEAQNAFKTFIRVMKAELPKSAKGTDSAVVDTETLNARVAARHKSLAATMQEILDARGLDIAVTADLVLRFESHKAHVTTDLSSKGQKYTGAESLPAVIEGLRVALDDLVSNKLPLTRHERRSNGHPDASNL